jgi:flagellar basal body-associated protein FliL
MWNDINWPTVIAGAIVAVISAGGGIIVARWNRKSQVEANQLTGSGQVFTQQSTLLQDIQEERAQAKAELKAEREQNKKDIGLIRQEFEDFKTNMKSQLSGYRAYINGLRGQVHELGGVPIEWPANLDQ